VRGACKQRFAFNNISFPTGPIEPFLSTSRSPVIISIFVSTPSLPLAVEFYHTNQKFSFARSPYITFESVHNLVHQIRYSPEQHDHHVDYQQHLAVMLSPQYKEQAGNRNTSLISTQVSPLTPGWMILYEPHKELDEALLKTYSETKSERNQRAEYVQRHEIHRGF